MRLGEKTTVLKFHRNPLRENGLNAPKVYRIVIHLRICPFDSQSHMCLIVNLYMFYPRNVLVDLDSPGPRTNSS